LNLVTGATGIIGSHVVLKLLQDGKPVVAGRQTGSDINKVKQLSAYYNAQELFNKIKWANIDVCDIFSIEEAMEDVSTVYHCAGYVSFDKRNREKLFKLNESGTANVVNVCLEKGVVLCHVSSIGTINNLDYTAPLNEAVFWKKSGRESDYAISKYNAEREVWRGIEEGLKAVIVNPAVVLAPGFWDQSSSRVFTTCFKGNKFYTLGNVGLVSARDVADCMIQLTERKHYANRYILVENNYRFKDLFDMIQSGFGKPLPGIRASRSLLIIGSWADGILSKLRGKEPALTKALVQSALNKQTLSNAKIRETLGFHFEPIPALIGKICNFYLQDRKKGA
jgi:nucleoside-diphosphate-sugar epimerase